MSTVEANVEVEDHLVPGVTGGELTEARNARVGSMTVRRMLPLRLRRSVGPWCFVDHYGPMDVDGVTGMNVPPHPHIGLQTVTWLVRGTVLHGVQLWVALPDASRQVEPGFEHHAELPQTSLGGWRVTVFMGDLAGTDSRSPATTFWPVAGAELSSAEDRPASAELPLRPEFEHVFFVATGQAEVEGVRLEPGHLLYLPTGRHEASVAAPGGSTLFLLGGAPLGEPLLMWWNFVARTPEEIAAATTRWRAGEFGTVGRYQGKPLPAPPLDVARLVRPPR
jgi:quercetin 2,3-dioxygenase